MTHQGKRRKGRLDERTERGLMFDIDGIICRSTATSRLVHEAITVLQQKFKKRRKKRKKNAGARRAGSRPGKDNANSRGTRKKR